ncbi:MAG: hypothetical protein H0Z29_10640 [Candidatus Marinimicrobia bacterium]|nr:hypothetical protein [Candidatus Neomarinimicrobiota bacterium]
MKLEKAIIEKLEKDLETVKTMDDLPGKNGVIKRLNIRLTEQMLQYERYQKREHQGSNLRNGIRRIPSGVVPKI